MINLLRIAMSATSVVVPNQQVSIQLYTGQIPVMNNNNQPTGKVIPQYAPAVLSMATIMLEDKQRLEHTDGYDITKILKRFYIPMTVNGLNRALNKGGDLITTVADGVVYKTIEVIEQFNTGYTCVIGISQ